MESRAAGGLTHRRPAGWEHSSRIDFNEGGPNGSPQGPGKGIEPTSRSMQGVIPGEIGTQLDQAPGGFLGQILMGRPGMALERSKPGDDSNIVPSSFGPSSKGPMVTKGGVQGGAALNRHIGSGSGGF